MPAFDGIAFDDAVASGGGGGGGGSFPLGNDPFDNLLNKTCAILKNQSAKDGYGQKSAQPRDFTTILDNVRCRISTDAIGRPKEFKVEKKSSLSYVVIFMRPPALPGGAKLTPHHWLKIEGQFYNIFEVKNPGGLNHHYEVISELVIP